MKNFTTLLLLIVFTFSFIIFIPDKASAHQPRLVMGNNFIEVNNPNISQAFYNELKGQPQIYQIKSDQNFTLYVNILVPKITDPKKDINADIYIEEAKPQNQIGKLSSQNFDWKLFDEPFGGDEYWQGPEFQKVVPSGTYIVKISSPNNQGKYSVAIGEKESFPLTEIIKTIGVLPALKKDFFDKSPWTAFFNYSGLFLAATLVLIIIIIFVILKIIKRIRKNKRKSSEINLKR